VTLLQNQHQSAFGFMTSWMKQNELYATLFIIQAKGKRKKKSLGVDQGFSRETILKTCIMF